MDLRDIITRAAPPAPWAEGNRIPWNEPGFSERVLKEHLSQDHDMASRRRTLVDRHIQWIHDHILDGKASRILDLCCGPGLYGERLARLGHTYTGIDFSPASISYARSRANAEGLTAEYRHQDVREAAYGSNLDLAMLVFGEINVFRPSDTATILRKAREGLVPGGHILLEPQTFECVQEMGLADPQWHSHSSGLFSPRPHLWLEERFWDDETRTTTTRYFIVDAASGHVDRYASTTQAYTVTDFERLLHDAGFTATQFVPTLTGQEDGKHPGLFAISATAPG